MKWVPATLNSKKFSNLLDKSLLIIILLATGFIFSFYWQENRLPTHDTMAVYEIFYSFYSHFFFYHQFPLWFPYGGYGIPSSIFQIQFLTPAMYFVGIIGYIFNITNTLALFKFSIFVELLIYIFGMYLIGKSFYHHILSRIAVLGGALCSITWFWQIGLNFHLFYLMPLILFSLFNFLKTSNAKWLYYAGLVFFINAIGNAIYFLILQTYVLLIVFLSILLSEYRVQLKHLFSKNVLKSWQLAILIGVICIFLLIFINAKHELFNLSFSRNSTHFTNDLPTFLNYARQPPGYSLFGLLTGSILIGDNTYYIGLLPIFLVLYGILFTSDVFFFGLVLGCLTLFALSLGGYIATFFYYFPGMPFYRHLSLTFGLFGCLMLIASGFSLDNLLYRVIGKFSFKNFLLIIFLTLILIDSFLTHRPGDLATKAWDNYTQNHSIFSGINNAYFSALLLMLIFVIYISLKRKILPAKIPYYITAPLVGVFLFDIGNFQQSIISFLATYADVNLSVISPPLQKKIFAANAMPFLPQRSENNLIPIAEDRLKILLQRNNAGAIYDQPFSLFVNEDLCYPTYRLDLMERGVNDALISFGGNPKVTGKSFLPRQKIFQEYLGCDSPKIRLFSNYIMTDSYENSLNKLKKITHPLNILLLTGSSNSYHKGGEKKSKGTVSVTQFNNNGIEIAVHNTSDNLEALSYVDAYHSHWRATLDANPTPIYPADVGFKAVLVPPGYHQIIFRYGNWFDFLSSYFLGLSGVLFIIIMILLLAKECVITSNEESYVR